MSEDSFGIDKLNQLFHEYSPNDLVRCDRNTAAYANDVYDVTDSAGGRYMIKVLTTQRAETVKAEALMQERLASSGVTSPKFLKFENGSYVGEHHGTRFTLSKFIEGSAPSAQDVTIDLVADFGATLAKMHDCLKGVRVPASNMQWFERKHLQANLDAYHGDLKDELVRLYEASKTLFDLELPEAVVHADLWLRNVFAKGDKITAVFDLETAENTVRITDLARTFVSMRLNTKFSAQELSDALLGGYDSAASTPLTNEEKLNFPMAVAYVACVCAVWHALHGTRYAGPYAKFGNDALAGSPER